MTRQQIADELADSKLLEEAERLEAAHILETTADKRYVYFLQAGERGSIKIGMAKNPDKRIAHISGAHPVKLRVLGIGPGGRRMELFLHALFAKSRLNGEWFRPSRKLRQWIRALSIKDAGSAT